MNCPKCHNRADKWGTYRRPKDQKRVQRYRCRECARSFSDQTFAHDYRLRLRHFNQTVFRLLCSGVSQRRIAFIVGTKPVAVSRRVVLFGTVAERNLATYRRARPKAKHVLIDEMESFEHTKCKPLTIPIAVEEKTRKILSLDVGQIAAKGRLAAVARARYGLRRCRRGRVLKSVFRQLQTCCVPDSHFKSDESVHYPSRVRFYFPRASHETFKGRRGCIVGQGELKAGGWDPLFSLNHTYAMFRDNLKTLSRRTWCTTKRPDRLRNLMHLYAWFHNLRLDTDRTVFLRSLAANN